MPGVSGYAPRCARGLARSGLGGYSARMTSAASPYTRTETRRALIAADGSTINYAVNEYMLEQGYADQFPGARVVEFTDEVEVAPYERVLIDSGIPEEHWPLLRADMTRMRNMARDAGRPSDAMRSAVAAFKAGHLTEESFAASRPSGHYPEDAR